MRTLLVLVTKSDDEGDRVVATERLTHCRALATIVTLSLCVQSNVLVGECHMTPGIITG